MKFKLLLITSLVFITVTAIAQSARFLFSGTIEYEKKVNVHALLKEDFVSSEWLENYVKSNPQFKVMKSMLSFSGNKIKFEPEIELGTSALIFTIPEAEQVNIRYTDLSSQTYISQKTLLEDLFLVRDSVRKINWKLTSEMRTIAGYECRRANTIIMDSVYVVAFYTPQIPVPGGPESFSGLPGMILGIAMPREHISWFATKVVDRDIFPGTIKPPVSGKPTNEALIREVVKKNMADHKWQDLQRMLRTLLL